LAAEGDPVRRSFAVDCHTYDGDLTAKLFAEIRKVHPNIGWAENDNCVAIFGTKDKQPAKGSLNGFHSMPGLPSSGCPPVAVTLGLQETPLF
jgi:hypothetical protein